MAKKASYSVMVRRYGPQPEARIIAAQTDIGIEFATQCAASYKQQAAKVGAAIDVWVQPA